MLNYTRIPVRGGAQYNNEPQGYAMKPCCSLGAKAC